MIILLPSWPTSFRSQLSPSHLIYSTKQQHFQLQDLEQGRVSDKALQMCLCLSPILHLIRLVKNIYSGPSQYGRQGFAQNTCSSIAISLTLKSPSSSVSQGISSISNFFSVGQLLLMIHSSSQAKIWHLFKYMSLHIKLNISPQWLYIINTPWSSFMLLSPLSHTCKIHS